MPEDKQNTKSKKRAIIILIIVVVVIGIIFIITKAMNIKPPSHNNFKNQHESSAAPAQTDVQAVDEDASESIHEYYKRQHGG